MLNDAVSNKCQLYYFKLVLLLEMAKLVQHKNCCVSIKFCCML